MKEQRKIRVLIVEDSRVNQSLLKGILAEDPVFEVIGLANNGKEALEFIACNRPDVISMDIYMPEMDGVSATRQIMQHTPVPIVIVSSFYNPTEVRMSFNILEAGALTILPRPFGPGHLQYHSTARNYRNTLKTMAEVKVKAISRRVEKSLMLLPEKSSAEPGTGYKVIAIGASAGGPQAIQLILKNLPASIPVPILLVQHIDANFAEGYREWLGSVSNLPVHTATNGEVMVPGHVYLPPGNLHLGLKNQGVVAVIDSPPEKGLRPAVCFLFRNVNRFYGKNAIGIILSGMGSDGAAELKLLHDCGAHTIAQDAQSSLVHGMPGEAIRIGGVSRVLSPIDIVQDIITLLQK